MRLAKSFFIPFKLAEACFQMSRAAGSKPINTKFLRFLMKNQVKNAQKWQKSKKISPRPPGSLAALAGRTKIRKSDL